MVNSVAAKKLVLVGMPDREAMPGLLEKTAKAAVAAGVTADLTARLSAVDLVKAAAEALGGKGGGGRPDMAQAGGADATKADAAISAAETVIGGVK